ncbi:MAG: hypothetical protein UY20_C0002G0007 [Candidatus Yanofskybacteria bacterium GW2011_GWA1_48_10]|uniref:Uncharacterized protein n=2 Tax=Candidatus Yanofskyibacteriota TaxID=1752733 RepID=A0A0G1U7D5_9BACT|nr:MAG: hypothetical protein UY20_C0002G0007 [Candidatus Yanofskybacteria bacterium GW2011_GWA1_48_10]OGN05996.1 MAG: hypothetical protein A2669_01350 [Candidatus Yanofskybacteria bacterium RIFCSPHIGHO2_01_FULL_48_25b]
MKILLIPLWALSLALDSLFLPVLHIPTGFGAIFFLISMALYFGVQSWVIWWSIILALAAELILGAYLGAITGAWLAAVLVWHLINRTFNFKSAQILFGIILYTIFISASWLIVLGLYRHSLSSKTLSALISPEILLSAVIQIFLMLFILKRIFNNRHTLSRYA